MQTDPRKAGAEGRRLGSNTDVATQREAESRTCARAVDRRNDRFRQCSHHCSDLLTIRENAAETIFIFRFAHLLQVIDIASGRETTPFASYYQNADRIVEGNCCERVENLFAH